jgi:hypothetical protein
MPGLTFDESQHLVRLRVVRHWDASAHRATSMPLRGRVVTAFYGKDASAKPYGGVNVGPKAVYLRVSLRQ